MDSNFKNLNPRDFVPIPVCEDYPEYCDFYYKAWELAFDHVKDIPGMPQTPYMDEALCKTQVWIWDSCFMALFCKYARSVFPGVETLNNFYEVLHGDKRLPEIIPDETEPYWTGAKKGEPYEIKVHIADNPPLFAWAEYENALMSGDTEYIKDLLYKRRFLQKHYEWLENLKEKMNIRGVLCSTHWLAEKDGYKWEGGSSGMDNTPRGRLGESSKEHRPNNPNMLWLDAICQQALSAKLIAQMYALIGDKDGESEWICKYNQKKNIVNTLYWDEKDQFYYDIDSNNHEFYKVKTIASYWTMTSGIATTERAALLTDKLSDSDKFGGFVPLVTLARDDVDFRPGGGYWRGSVWLPTGYATLKGLTAYGYHQKAHEISLKLLEHMYKTYTDFEPHTIWECYSPTQYAPATNEVEKVKYVRPDFCGWSALGPIAVLVEYVLGFHTINAFTSTIEWEKPLGFDGETGIRNLHFGNITTDITAKGNKVTVVSDGDYTLKIRSKEYEIKAGVNEFVAV